MEKYNLWHLPPFFLFFPVHSVHYFMVNSLHVYGAFLVLRLLKVLHTTCQHSPIQTHILTLIAGAAMQSKHSHREQFGAQYLAQGHFDMWIGGAGDQTADLPIR